MSTLELDRTDPGVDELVSQWEDGGEYEVTLRIRQNSSDANMAQYEVLEVVNESESEAPEETEAEGEAETVGGSHEREGRMKGMKGKPAIMIAFTK